MTSDAAALAFRPATAASALAASVAVTVIAAAAIAGAWFFQLVLEILPCPLCL